MAQPAVKKYVLVIYTGGTIGMAIHPITGELVPVKGYLEELIATYPNFHDPEYTVTSEDKEVFKKALSQQEKWEENIFGLQKTKDNYRIVYGILELEKVIDSSNMDVADWVHFAELIQNNYEPYSGFVILHGTDTMAFTSSALSFMFENLGKAVVITGSQVPLAQLRTDAIENFIGALILAGQFGERIPEVGLFFNNTLYRGNRVTKVNASGFHAFESPNYLPLAQIGVDFDIHYSRILEVPTGELEVHKDLDSEVGVFMLFPGITKQMVTAFLTAVNGAVIMSFGAGNGPSDLQEVFKLFSDKKLMVNITQCLKGTVEQAYATAVDIEAGGDMTPEAALTKISYLLKRSDLPLAEKKKYLHKDLRGEITIPSQES